MGVAIMPCDTLTQTGVPECVGIAKRRAGHFPHRGFTDQARRGRSGLADLHMDDVLAPGLAGACIPHEVHGDEGADAAPQRWGNRSAILCALCHAGSLYPAANVLAKRIWGKRFLLPKPRGSAPV